MMKHTATSYLFPLLLLLLVSCQREQWEPVEEKELSFTASMSSQDTKAGIFAGTTLPTDISLGISAYKYDTSAAAESAWTLHSSPAVTRADHDASRSGASGKWVPVQRMLWPGEGYVRYFAYAPYGASGVSVTAASGAAPSLSFAVDPDPDKQIDLLVADAASSAEREGNPPVTAIDVPITFCHALTGVRFKASNNLVVSEITVTGVYCKGALKLGTLAWEADEEETATYTLTNPSLDELTLLLLPQVLPAGARITATVTDGMDTRTVNALMDGEVWAPGKIVVYSIFKDADALLFEMDPLDDFVVSGASVLENQSRSVSVNLRRTGGLRASGPAPWKAYFAPSAPSEGDAVDPSWSTMPLKDAYGRDYLTLSAYEGDGNANPVEITLSQNALQDGVLSLGTKATTMAGAMSARNLGTVDLSTLALSGNAFTKGHSAETANSYVVNGYGTFLIPMVYGNCIKNGAATTAYQGATGGKFPLATFLNADAKAITSAYILSDSNLSKSGSYSARIVWQDTLEGKEIVEDVQVEYCATKPSGAALSCPYIRFKVNPYDAVTGKGLKPGNIVIALYDNTKEKILWSWHIWFTDERFTTTDVYYTSVAFERHLNVNLGWVPPNSVSEGAAPGRSQYVIMVCTETGKVMDVFKAGQEIYSDDLVLHDYANLLYQWGRKDPFLSTSDRADNTIHTHTSRYYRIVGDSPYRVHADAGTGDQTENLGWMIRNPYIFLSGSNTYPQFKNLWNADKAVYSDRDVKKSIYDPSPRGFRLPRLNSYVGVADGTAYSVWIEGSGDQISGRNYSRTYHGAEKDFYFPASGERNTNGQVVSGNYGKNGYAWTAASTDISTTCYCLNFMFDTSLPKSSAHRAYGKPVRPVKDE